MSETTKTTPLVTVGYAYTVNLGDFENVKVHVEVTDTVRANENVEQAYLRIDKFVTSKVSNEVAQARQSRNR